MLADSEVEDVQNSVECRNIPLHRVGIKDLLYPVQILDFDAQQTAFKQHTVGNFSLYVDLAGHLKGTHMSRFLEVLKHGELCLSTQSITDFLDEVAQRLDAQSSFLDVSFPFFLSKKAPVSHTKSLMDYHVNLHSTKQPSGIKNEITLTVPVTSLCPCSKKISEYGAHNQRSHIVLTALYQSSLSISQLIALVEKEASCELYGLLKRPDEKVVTERAYDNPKFVEDMVRDVARQLDKQPEILAYKLSSENFESIHNHSAFAQVVKGY